MKDFLPTLTNDTIIFGDSYKGLPIAECSEGFFARNMDDALATIDGAMEDSSQLVISSFSLFIPNKNALFQDNHTDDTVLRFIHQLERKAQRKQVQMSYGNAIKVKAKIDYLFDKNHNNKCKVYHVMLFLNQEAYVKQHPYHPDANTFVFRVASTWAQTLNEPECMGYQYIKFSGQRVRHVDDSADSLVSVFKKASNLCKANTTENGLGCYSFYSSRQYREPSSKKFSEVVVRIPRKTRALGNQRSANGNVLSPTSI